MWLPIMGLSNYMFFLFCFYYLKIFNTILLLVVINAIYLMMCILNPIIQTLKL